MVRLPGLIGFVGGALVSTAGVALLKSKPARKAATTVTSGVLIAKDAVMETAEKVQAEASDILADAQVMTEKYYEEKDAEFARGLEAAEKEASEAIEAAKDKAE